MLSAIPNPYVLLSPLTTQEAVLSSRIEGTQATMGEVFQFEAGQKAKTPERREDIWEVLNYRRAIREAEQLLETLPMSQRVVKEAHKVLLASVRGQNKSPGEYRRIPNWIGPPGCMVEDARFVPVPADKLQDGMTRWEQYLHEDAPDRLVQLAIAHAEFEALHPFLDGNGRLGRMLVPLFMWQMGLIRQPMFYISAYFEARRDDYYEGLMSVSRDDNWTGWCRFFLEAVRAQAEDNLNKASGILKLYEDMKMRVSKATRSQYSIHALDWIFTKPVFQTTDYIKTSGIPEATARRILSILLEEGILDVLQPGSGRRAAILDFPRLLAIAEGVEES